MKSTIRSVAIGRLRNIKLLDQSERELADSLGSLLMEDSLVARQFPGSSFEVIGVVNETRPVFTVNGSEEQLVYVLDYAYSSDAYVVQIAANSKNLQLILGLLDAVWHDYADDFSLPNDDRVIEEAQKTLRAIRAMNPASDIQYWYYLAFREYEIDL